MNSSNLSSSEAKDAAWPVRDSYFDTIIATTTDGYWEVNAEGRIVEFNDQCTKIYGYGREELVGMAVADFEATRDPAQTSAHIREILEVGHARFETRHRRKDGRVIDVEVSTAYHKGRGRFLTFLRDITERRKGEVALRESEGRYQAVVATFFDGCLVHQDGRIVVANPAFAGTFGYAPAEVAGLLYTAVIGDGSDDPTSVSPTEQSARSRVVEGRRKDGSILTVEVAGCPCMLNGRSARIEVVRDLSEQKRLEEEREWLKAQLSHAQRMESIGCLAGGIAHDLNNILSPIVTIASILREKQSEQQDRDLLEVAKASAIRGAEIIQQLLVFSRRQKGEKVAVAPQFVVAEIVALLRETFPRDIKIRVRIDRDLWGIQADQTQLYQVLLNLCVNARDAMPDGGELEISAANRVVGADRAKSINAPDGNYVVLSVGDTGHGIPPEVRERIFDPFFTTKPVGKGTGLGLSTVLGIVQEHGGAIAFDSKPSDGTIFSVYLPARAEAAAATGARAADVPNSPTQPARVSGAKRTVLIVDDEPNILLALRLLLERSGYQVIAVGHGEEGLRQFLQIRDKLSVVITDLTMPVMGGLAFVRELRSIDTQVRVIILSGLTDTIPPKVVAELAIDQVLKKPVDPAVLLAAIE